MRFFGREEDYYPDCTGSGTFYVFFIPVYRWKFWHSTTSVDWEPVPFPIKIWLR